MHAVGTLRLIKDGELTLEYLQVCFRRIRAAPGARLDPGFQHVPWCAGVDDPQRHIECLSKIPKTFSLLRVDERCIDDHRCPSLHHRCCSGKQMIVNIRIGVRTVVGSSKFLAESAMKAERR